MRGLLIFIITFLTFNIVAGLLYATYHFWGEDAVVLELLFLVFSFAATMFKSVVKSDEELNEEIDRLVY